MSFLFLKYLKLTHLIPNYELCKFNSQVLVDYAKSDFKKSTIYYLTESLNKIERWSSSSFQNQKILKLIFSSDLVKEMTISDEKRSIKVSSDEKMMKTFSSYHGGRRKKISMERCLCKTQSSKPVESER